MKKLFFILLIGLLILGLFVGGASAAITGTGTQDDPYKIWTYDDLKQLSGSTYASYAGDKYFELETDITFDSSWGEIGTTTYKFSGHFDGKEHKLDFINISNYAFFNNISSCEIKNVNIHNLSMSFIRSAATNGSSQSFSNIHLYDCHYVSYTRSTAFGFISRDSRNLTLSNISATNCYIKSSGISQIGILFGDSYLLSAENISVSNVITECSENNISLIIGGVFGIQRTSNAVMNNVSVSNVQIVGTSTDPDYYVQIGGVLGNLSGSNTTLTNANVSKLTIYTQAPLSYIGGVFGGNPYNTGGNMSEIHVSDSSLMSTNTGGFAAGISDKAKSLSNATVTNTNIYTASPEKAAIFTNSGSHSGTSSGITHDSGIYLRLISGASLINNAPQSSPKNIGDTVTFSVNGQQGAAVYVENNQVKSGYSFNYGTGGTQVGTNPLTASYSSAGTKNASVTLTGWNRTSKVNAGTLTGTAYIKVPLTLEDFTTNPTSESYAPISTSVTLTAVTSGGTPTSYAWSYTTDPNPSASSSWTNIGTTSTNTTTFSPTTAGTYTFRVVASMSGASADSLEVPIKPYLYIIATLNGSGTQSDPYQVGSDSDLQQWNTYPTYYSDKYMSITQDFTPATTISQFAGTLSGNNHTLTNSRLPLFNTLGGTVSNLKFSKAIVNGNGLLANTSSAAVSNVTAEDCFISGTTAGGLAGSATGSFTDCSVNHITVKGTSAAAGIAARGNMTVTRCKVLNSDLLAPITYGLCSAANLPDEYQEVEYIECTGTQRIASGIYANNQTRTQLDFSVYGSGSIYIYGTRLSNNTMIYNVGGSATGGTYNVSVNGVGQTLDIGTRSSSSKYYRVNLDFATNNGTVTYTAKNVETSKTDSGSFNSSISSTPNVQIYLFSNGQNYMEKGRIYSCVISQNGEIVREFVPCYRKSDGVIGMYDLVTNTLFTNSGTGTFLKGSNVN